MKLLNKLLLSVLFLAAFLVKANNVFAENLTNVSDTITTSRPSASAPLSADQAASASQLTVFDNGSFYLASDSAKLFFDTGQSENVISVASMSAQNTPSAGQRTVYLATVPSNTHHKGTVVAVPQTAVHTIQFTLNQAIPAGGSVTVNFPGSADNSASPSASSFAFNNLNAAGGLPSTVVTDNITCNANSYVTSPQIYCETTGSVTAGTIVTVLIGCTAQTSGVCTSASPRLINPTKTANTGTADIWKVYIATKNASSTILDDVTISIGTIESITVRANIDPSLTFTIAGITSGTAVNNGNATGCLQAELTNSGVNSTSTEVNLGTLSNSPTAIDTKVNNISAQLLTVSTNGGNGYVLTATSSGKLTNPATGYFLLSTITPQAFPSNGGHFFGFHACGLDTYGGGISTTFWNSTASNTNCNSYIGGSSGNLCLYGWPTTTSSITLASDTSGPVGNSLVAGNGLVSVAYAGGADASLAPGQYTSVVTYVATPSF